MKLKLMARVAKNKKSERSVWTLDYDEVRHATEGLSLIKLNGMYGFADQTGREVIPPKFLDARPFSEGRAAVKLFGDKWGYIDNKGEIAIPIKYEEVDNYFHKGKALVRLKDKFFYIDVNGNTVS